jgi:hypothetical protein
VWVIGPAAAGPDHLTALEDEDRLPVRRRCGGAAEHVGELVSPQQPGEVGPLLRTRVGGYRGEGGDSGQIGGSPAEPAGEVCVVTAQ